MYHLPNKNKPLKQQTHVLIRHSGAEKRERHQHGVGEYKTRVLWELLVTKQHGGSGKKILGGNAGGRATVFRVNVEDSC